MKDDVPHIVFFLPMKYKISLDLVTLEAAGCHLLVAARWQKRKLRLVLDTGASKTVFDTRLVQQWFPHLELQASEQASAGLGTQSMQSATFILVDFKLGKCKVKQMEVAALDLQHILETYDQLEQGPIHGILGGDILLKYGAKIDYQKLRLTLQDDL
jgi:hypothetical protein